jgi:hypothetical protein
MKATASVILLAACGLAAPAAAQSGEGPVLQTKWSLDQPRKKAPAKRLMPSSAQPRQQAAAVGPAVPAAPRVKVSKTRTAARAPQPARSNRVNATPLAAAIVRKQNKQQ